MNDDDSGMYDSDDFDDFDGVAVLDRPDIDWRKGIAIGAWK